MLKHVRYCLQSNLVIFIVNFFCPDGDGGLCPRRLFTFAELISIYALACTLHFVSCYLYECIEWFFYRIDDWLCEYYLNRIAHWLHQRDVRDGSIGA